jgi:hypothetical protein
MADHTVPFDGISIDRILANSFKPIIKLRAMHETGVGYALGYRLDAPANIFPNDWGKNRCWQIYGLKTCSGQFHAHAGMRYMRFQRNTGTAVQPNQWGAFADFNSDRYSDAIDLGQDWIMLRDTDLGVVHKPFTGVGMFERPRTLGGGLVRLRLRGTKHSAFIDPTRKVADDSGAVWLKFPMAIGIFNKTTMRTEQLAYFKLMFRILYTTNGSQVASYGDTYGVFKL